MTKKVARVTTIKDLANELGLSDRAVSQALNPRESNVKLNPETAQRIRKLAEKRNYRPNSLARGMRARRFFNIGFFDGRVPRADEEIGYSLLGADTGAYKACQERGYNLTIVRLVSNGSNGKIVIPRVFKESHLDALLIVNAGGINDEIRSAITEANLPIIYLNEKRPENAVYVNDREGAYLMTRHLIERGYRRILFNGIAETLHYSMNDRLEGYVSAMEKAKLKPLIYKRPDVPSWKDELLKILRDASVEAVFSHNSLDALRFFQVIYNTEIRVPRDLALVSYGDDWFDRYCPVRLTTMCIPFSKMAAEGIRMAITLVEDPTLKKIPSVAFSPTLRIGDSSPEK